MAKDDMYEIMPYKEIVELKKQIEELQRKTGDTSSQELLNSMAALTKSMNNMLQLFSAAAEEMKIEEKEEGALSEKLDPLLDKIDRLEDQNRIIAEGLVAIADMVKEVKGANEEEKRTIPKPEKQGFEEYPELSPLEPPGLAAVETPDLPPLEPPAPMRGPMPMPGSPFSTGSPRVVARRPMPPQGVPPWPGPVPPRGMPPWPGPMPPQGMPPGPPDFGPLPPLPPLGEEPQKKRGMFGLFKK